MSSESLFGKLSKEDYNRLKMSLAEVTVLIAGADGKIDEQELNWAEKLTSIRSYATPEELNQFYGDVEESFIDNVNDLIKQLPTDVAERQTCLSEELAKLNQILPLLENQLAFQIYESLTSFAEHIAKASGGFLRFGSISGAEKKWISLPMIDPIILEEEDE